MPGFHQTMIPVDSKLAKTEKNRLRLIMQSNQQDDDDEDLDKKERKIKKSTIPRYRSKVPVTNFFINLVLVRAWGIKFIMSWVNFKKGLI